MKKILIITPHLSTGGMPQYLFKYIQHIKKDYNKIKVVEVTNSSNDYIIQKNRIIKEIGKENLIEIGNVSDWSNDNIYNKKTERIIQIIIDFDPDVIFMSESPETYEYKKPPHYIMEKIYDKNRKYKIIEGIHSNSFDFKDKVYIPDEFVFCCDSLIEKSKDFNIPKSVWEYPIEKKERPDRGKTLYELGLNPKYLHILHVGLFNENKNQKYIYDLAEKFKNNQIMFHFIGNDCFFGSCNIEEYKINNPNCKIWGERDDVEKFMSCMDIFIFPSKKELNPIAVKEALSWGMDVISSDSYDTSKYKNFNNFYLLNDINVENFITEKYNKINDNDNEKFLIVCSFYNNTQQQIKQTFDNVLNQTYKNWLFIVGDDFSDNNCKELLKNEIKLRNNPNILFYDIKYKRELYLYQNLFKTINYDYYYDLDSDDILENNLLEVYHNHFKKYPDVFFIFCDYEVRSEDKKLERISCVKNQKDKDWIYEFYDRTKSSYNNIWAKYHSWNMYGTARCFRKIKENKFEIEKKCKSSTDSLVLFSCLRKGNFLNVPRNLYTAIKRNSSDSSVSLSLEEINDYNKNAILNINEYKKDKKYGSLNIYDDVWLETNALSFSGITKENKNINIVSELTEEQFSKIKYLYYDKNIFLNDLSENNLVIIWNKLNEKQREDILKILNSFDSKFVIYYFIDDFDIREDNIMNHFSVKTDLFLKEVKKEISIFNYFCYFRHIIVCR